MKIVLLKSIMLFAMFSLFPQIASAIGQTTDPIIINDALRGETFEKELIIVNTEKESAAIEIAAGGDIAEWTKFFKTNDLKNPITIVDLKAGEKINLLAELSIPLDVKNGTYSGVISAIKKPKDAESSSESSVSISQKIDRKVEIEVNDEENISIRVSVIPSKFDYEEKESLKVRFIYDNQGNVSVRPDVNFKIKKNDKAVFNITFPFPEDVQSIKPKAIYEIPGIEVPTVTLENGQYVAKIDFVVDQKTISTEKFGFSIGRVAGISAFFGENIITIVKQSIYQNWTALALIAIITFIFVVFSFLKSRKENNN